MRRLLAITIIGFAVTAQAEDKTPETVPVQAEDQVEWVFVGCAAFPVSKEPKSAVPTN